MSHHEGVSCDSCLKSNFRGKRYKCLICFDYDLCAACHDSGSTSARHVADHPMQCILTRNDLDLFYSGEQLTNDQPHSFSCPFCGKLGFTDNSLYDHVNTLHTDTSTEVVCPICATLPGGEPNQVTDDFLTHMNLEHRNNRESEEPQIVRIRSRHHVRGLNNNRARRSQFFNSNGSTSSSSNTRDTIDPIAQLLSQLSDVRRINNSTNGQNLMQFQFDRQTSANRLPIERIIRRHQQSSQLSSSLTTTQPESNSNPQSLPYMVLMDSTTSPSINTNSLLKSNSTGVSQINKISTKYLLSSYSATALIESEQQKLESLQADRSIFVEELIIATLTNPLNIDNTLLDSKSEIADEVKTSNLNNDKIENLDQNKIENSQEIVNKESSKYCLTSDYDKSSIDNSNKPDKCKSLTNKQKKCATKPNLDCNIITSSSSLNFSENVQQKLPSRISTSPNPTFIVPQPTLNHRNRVSKVRSTASINTANLPTNLASLTYRSSLTAGPGPTLSVVSPTGRRKILKQATEPTSN